jgi:hypothetical protein
MLIGREITTNRYRLKANDAVAGLGEGCKKLFSNISGKLPPGVSGHGLTMNLLDGVKNLANNAYFYSMSGPESNFSFRDIGVGGHTRTITQCFP